MKKIIIKGLLISLFVAGTTMFNVINAQGPPAPPAEQGKAGDVPGGGAPIGEGLLILSVLGAAYGSKKWYSNHKKNIAE